MGARVGLRAVSTLLLRIRGSGTAGWAVADIATIPDGSVLLAVRDRLSSRLRWRGPYLIEL